MIEESKALTGDVSPEAMSIFGSRGVFAKGIYQIPIYQRNYAWESNGRDGEIDQFIEDIDSLESVEPDEGELTHPYYLGSLVIKEREDDEGRAFLEVVDGQQRLTTVFLILRALMHLDEERFKLTSEEAEAIAQSTMGLLGIESEEQLRGSLSYACREKACRALADPFSEYTEELRDADILAGYRGIIETFERLSKGHDSKKDWFDQFIKKLERAKLFRIPLPSGTDLNRYFEIMNTRGEQLLKHEVIKARLLEPFGSEEKGRTLARVWDACSQMGTPVLQTLGKLGGVLSDQDALLLDPEEYLSRLTSSICDSSFVADEESIVLGKTVLDAITDKSLARKRASRAKANASEVEAESKSIVDFEHFLLHVLTLYQRREGSLSALAQDDESLNENKLIVRFESVFSETSQGSDKERVREHSASFIAHLLFYRILFDRFIIESSSQNKERWVLDGIGLNDDIIDDDVKETIMLQSCLRVTYTSPKAMHWITAVLDEISSKRYDDTEHFWKCMRDSARRIAKENACKGFDDLKKKDYKWGTGTPNIVLNYLDFLLWKDESLDMGEAYQERKEHFSFAFRSSVEHWYPQHPTDFKAWDDVDRFGNLALMPQGRNSWHSNYSPAAKAKMVNDDSNPSLKLVLMAELTKDDGSHLSWKRNRCGEHEKMMIEILEKDFDPNASPSA